MKPTLVAGVEFKRSWPIDGDRCISFMGDQGRVYATPSMVRDIEMSCRDFLLTHLDPGEDSVGTRVEVDHLAATPLGMNVTVVGQVTELNGRAVSFDIAVHDELEQVGRGKHFRFVVDVAKTAQRVAAKRQKAGL